MTSRQPGRVLLSPQPSTEVRVNNPAAAPTTTDEINSRRPPRTDMDRGRQRRVNRTVYHATAAARENPLQLTSDHADSVPGRRIPSECAPSARDLDY